MNMLYLRNNINMNYFNSERQQMEQKEGRTDGRTDNNSNRLRYFYSNINVLIIMPPKLPRTG